MEMLQNRAKVLLYQLPEMDAKGHAIRSYLREHGIAIVNANPTDGGRSLVSIMGVGKGSPGKAEALPGEPVLVIYGLEERQLNEFLAFLRRKAPIELKAVATVHNLQWTFGYLTKQLMAERSYFGKKK